MQLNQFSLKQFLLKAVLYITILYAFVVSISLLTTATLFFGLNVYKNKIENLIFERTGYTLTVNTIHTGLSNTLAPKITINNIKLTNHMNPKQIVQIKQIQLILSYASLWNLAPVFAQINVDGTDLNLEHLDDGSILLNGIKLNPPKNSTSKKSKLDIEALLLKQEQIKLSHINISFINHNLPKLSLYNVNTILQKHFGNKHSLIASLGKSRDEEAQILRGTLNWKGGKFSKFKDWQEAELVVQSYDAKSPLQLPTIGMLSNKFNADTAIDAQLKNGKLQFFYANFDIKNLHYMMTHHQNLINFPQLGGSIKVTLINNDHYTFEANNLTVATNDGYILDNNKISGNYIIGKKGDLSIINTDMSMFNNLIAMFPVARKLYISGLIEIVKLSWVGNITHPDSFNIAANFTNLGIKSKDENIPSINNINGNLSVNKESGAIRLNLNNSTLDYPKVFLVPYKFNSLTSQISWQTHPDKSFEVNLGNTVIDEIDFKGNVKGQFKSIPGTNGYLDLTAHIDRMQTSKVGNYLPIVIGMPVHKWLNAGLIGGYAVNANLTLSGWLANFPFTDGNGKFYIDADVDHGKLNYVDKWPPLEDIMGKFQIRNQKIIIIANSAKISGNNIDKATVIIPDMTASGNVYLTADGLASGSTSKFMTYLSQTPINEIIGKIPEKINVDGNGMVKLHLMVPFSAPLHTKVDGSYTFDNNNIQFDLPVPLLANTTGTLFFSEHGLKINDINTNTLNSNANLSVVTDPLGTMHFKVYSPNLDYRKLAAFYLPFMYSAFNGKAATKINFDIGKKGINQISATSNLLGTKIAAPYPIGKESSNISEMEFILKPNNNKFNIDFNYAKTLYGTVLLNEHGKLEHSYISVGSSKLPDMTSNQPKILVYMNTRHLDAVAWLETVLKTIKPTPESGIAEIHQIYANKTTHESSVNIFPLEVLINTNNLLFYNTNYQQANADILVQKDEVLFNLNNTLTDGLGSFVFASKKLTILLNKFNLLKALDNAKELGKNKQINSRAEFTNLNQSKIDKSNITESNIHIGSKNIKPLIESITETAMSFPTVNLTVNDFYYENTRLASAKLNLKPQGSDLVIESSEISGKNTQINFHGVNYCLACGGNKSFVEIITNIKIANLGQMLDNFGYGTVVANGSGTIDATFQWNGKLQDFKLEHTIAAIKVDLVNGKFLKVSTGGIFGEILGIINLQTLTNLMHLNFSQSFSNGFYFNTLKIRAYLLNNIVTIKSFYMSGPLATVQSYGTININDETLDVYLNITPKLGAGFAIGAGAATLNPIIGPIVGIAVYAGEWILGQPLNKLFSFGFHVTGELKKPTVTRIKVSDQALNNVNSALGLGVGGISNAK